MGRHMLELMAAFADVCDLSILCRTSERARWLFDSAAVLGARTVPLPSPHDPMYATVIADFLRSHHVGPKPETRPAHAAIGSRRFRLKPVE